MHVHFVGGERAGQFALDEFLVGRYGVDGALETDNGAGPFLGGRPQRESSPARQLAAGVGVPGRLREAGMRADPHHGIDPMRARGRIESGADDIADIGGATGRENHRELIAADAAAHRVRR